METTWDVSECISIIVIYSRQKVICAKRKQSGGLQYCNRNLMTVQCDCIVVSESPHHNFTHSFGLNIRQVVYVRIVQRWNPNFTQNLPCEDFFSTGLISGCRSLWHCNSPVRRDSHSWDWLLEPQPAIFFLCWAWHVSCTTLPPPTAQCYINQNWTALLRNMKTVNRSPWKCISVPLKSICVLLLCDSMAS